MNNTQHFSSQHNPMLYQHNTNTMNTADMQNSQFCYERSSVSLYSSGGEAQDARSLPPGNPVNHQMGGKSCDFLMSYDTSSSFSSQPFVTSATPIFNRHHPYQHLIYERHECYNRKYHQQQKGSSKIIMPEKLWKGKYLYPVFLHKES